MMSLPLSRISEECAHAGQLARRRRRAEPLPAPLGKEGAEIGSAEVEQAGALDLLSAIAAEELNQPMGGRDVGAHSMSGTASVVLQVRVPLGGERLGRMGQACG